MRSSEIDFRGKPHGLALTVDRQPVDDKSGSVDGVVVDVDAGPAAVTQHGLEPFKGLLCVHLLRTHNYAFPISARPTSFFGAAPRSPAYYPPTLFMLGDSTRLRPAHGHVPSFRS